jgi:hypothetical protein
VSFAKSAPRVIHEDVVNTGSHSSWRFVVTIIEPVETDALGNGCPVAQDLFGVFFYVVVQIKNLTERNWGCSPDAIHSAKC